MFPPPRLYRSGLETRSTRSLNYPAAYSFFIQLSRAPRLSWDVSGPAYIVFRTAVSTSVPLECRDGRVEWRTSGSGPIISEPVRDPAPSGPSAQSSYCARRYPRQERPKRSRARNPSCQQGFRSRSSSVPGDIRPARAHHIINYSPASHQLAVYCAV